MEVALVLRLPTLTGRRQAIETQLTRFGPALRLERHHLKAHLLLADAEALEMSQALGLSACPIAGEVFDELSTLHVFAAEPPRRLPCLARGSGDPQSHDGSK